jgi:pilus assembly protein CpaF
MNLSEKLAAASDEVDEDQVPAKIQPRPRPSRSTLLGRTRRPGELTAKEEAWSDSKRQVQQMVLTEVAPSAGDMEPEQLRVKVRTTVNEILEREDIGISPTERQRFVDEMLEDSLGYGPLEALLADGSITEIMCNAFDDIWIERAGMLTESEVTFASPDQYRRIIERMVAAVGRRVDESSPMVDARLADGSRINAIVPPLAVKAPILTIRKFPEKPLVMADLIAKGSVTEEAATFLEAVVRGKISLVVVGGTGTGKTTMLNVLSDYIPDGERLITIEESAELQLRLKHVVTLETRASNAEGSGEVRIRDLVRNSLRMRPDRIIVGECRGAETLDMLQAMNTGHPGSMTTVHANTPREVLARLETMVLMGGVELPQRAIREQIVMAVGLIVQLQRTVGGGRVISSITEVQGMEGDTVLLQDVFHRVGMSEGDGHLAPSGLRPKLLDELSANGINLSSTLFRSEPSNPQIQAGTRSERRAARPARPGRVDPPTEEIYDFLAQRRREGK